MLKLGSSTFNLDDEKIYFSIVREAEKINDSVLCERYSYEKLKVKVISCKVKNFSQFLMHYYCQSLIGVISNLYKTNNLNPRKAFIIDAGVFLTLSDFKSAMKSIEIAKKFANEEFGEN